MSRQPITPELLRAIGAQLADVPLSAEKAQAQAAVFETLMATIAELRSLPIKDIEPAAVYVPEEERR